MGVSSAGKTEEEYTKLTYDVSMQLAKTFLAVNPASVCIYVSGQGTDSSEKGKAMWARVKGRTENDLLKLGFKAAYMFRPGAIIPKKGVKSSTTLYRILIAVFKPLMYLMSVITPNGITNTEKIGKAMLALLDASRPSGVFNPKDINQLAQEL